MSFALMTGASCNLSGRLGAIDHFFLEGPYGVYPNTYSADIPMGRRRYLLFVKYFKSGKDGTIAEKWDKVRDGHSEIWPHLRADSFE